EATAYGTRVIIEAFEQRGIPIKELVAAGGLPEKNPLMMQIYSDVTGRPMKLAGSSQAPALGSAMHAAVAAGIYPNITAAAEKMGNVSERDPESGLIVMKPSGVRFDDLSPENMVIVDVDGKPVEGNYKPSSDTASHCYIYRCRKDVNGVVHTHSRYATAFAALG